MSLTFHLIPHTHWDREWFLTRASFQARLTPVIDEIIEQLETDADARFLLDGQTILLEDYLAIRPENEHRIAALVERGSLEIGPWYVLSDLLIPTAKSLRRNLLEGSRDAAKFGKCLDVLYSPDAFGHPAFLPELAAEFGIRRAVIRRGLGKPLDFYRWEGRDGETLLVHHLRKAGYDIAIDLAEAGTNLQSVWRPIRAELLEHAVTDQIAVFLGADHHAMVKDVKGLCARLQDLEPSATVRVSGLREFFDAVEKCDVAFPVLTGELRQGGSHTWVLQDVHSARARIKRLHSHTENRLSVVAEPLAGLAVAAGGAQRDGLLREAWRTLIQCQFHDTLAGSTSDAVQLEQMVRLNSVDATTAEIIRGSISELTGHDPDVARSDPSRVQPGLLIWNPSSTERRGIVTADVSFFVSDVLVGPPTGRVPRSGAGYCPFSLKPEHGAEIPVQVVSVERVDERVDSMRHYPDQDLVDKVRIVFEVPAVAPHAILRLIPTHSSIVAANTGLQVHGNYISNQYVSAEVSATGVVAFTDKRSGRVYENLFQLVDEGDKGDLYTFSGDGKEVLTGGEPRSQSITAMGPLEGTIETHWTLRPLERGEMGIEMSVTLHADSPVLQIRWEIINQASDHRLRVLLPGLGQNVVVGTSDGMVHRHAVSENSEHGGIEAEVRTAPAHDFVAAADAKLGMCVLQQGFFEYEATPAGDILITLFRSVGQISRNDLTERPGHAAWPISTPGAQEHGTHSIEMALLPIQAGDTESSDRLKKVSEAVNTPLVTMYLRNYSGGN